MTDQQHPPAWLAALFSYVAVGSRRRKSSEAHADLRPQRGRHRHPAGRRARRRGEPVIEYTNRGLPPVAVERLAEAIDAVAAAIPHQRSALATDDPQPGARAQLAARAERLRALPAPAAPAAEHPIVDRTLPVSCSDMHSNTLPSQVAPISAPPVPPEAPAPADATATREETDQ
jgi:hypothetical protein